MRRKHLGASYVPTVLSTSWGCSTSRLLFHVRPTSKRASISSLQLSADHSDDDWPPIGNSLEADRKVTFLVVFLIATMAPDASEREVQ